MQQLLGIQTADTDPALAEQLRAQQRVHLEESVAYAVDHLGIGERARRGGRG